MLQCSGTNLVLAHLLLAHLQDLQHVVLLLDCPTAGPVSIHHLCFPREHHDPWGMMPMEPAGKSPRAEQAMRSTVWGFHSDIPGEDEIPPSMEPSILFLCVTTLLPPKIACIQSCSVFWEMPGCFFVVVYGFKCFSFYCILQMQ